MRVRFVVVVMVCVALFLVSRALAQAPDCTVQRCVSLPIIEHHFVPTDTPTATAIPTETPVPTVAPPTPGLIVNGSFELGPNVGWIEVSDFPYDVIRMTFPGTAAPHTGGWAAWLGGDYDGSNAVVQQVTIDAGKHYLSYWHWIASADICMEDVGGVALLNDDGVVTSDEVVDAYLLCDDTNTGKWVRRSIDVRQFAGQTRLLFILAGTDSTLNSNLFIDDVSFEREKATEVHASGVESNEDVFIARNGEVRPANPSMKGLGHKVDALSRVQELLGWLSK